MSDDQRVAEILASAEHERQSYFRLVANGHEDSAIARECKTACNTMLAVLLRLGLINNNEYSRFRCN